MKRRTFIGTLTAVVVAPFLPAAPPPLELTPYTGETWTYATEPWRQVTITPPLYGPGCPYQNVGDAGNASRGR